MQSPATATLNSVSVGQKAERRLIVEYLRALARTAGTGDAAEALETAASQIERLEHKATR